jgi:zinc protease
MPAPTFARTTYAMPGPEAFRRVVLDNGLVVLVRENHAAPVVVIDGYLPAGAVQDPDDKTGLASFVAGMVTRGSAHFDFDTFNETVEGVGANLTVNADDHTTGFGATSLSEDFPTMLALLADVLRRPTFPVEQLVRFRSQHLVQLQERDQDTQQVANLRFYEALYPNHPYGRPNLGYSETVRTIQRDDLLAFHADHYTPNGALVVVAGDVDSAAAVALVERHFGDWRGGRPLGPVDQAVPPVPVLDQVKRAVYPLADKIQADIVLGCQAVARLDPDFYAVRVANTILGRFGMMGRLGERVREEQGLAYYVYSSQDAGPTTGVWLAAAGVNPVNVEKTVEGVLAEFGRLRDDAVPEEELADSQAYMTGVLPLTLETNEGVASTLVNMEYYGLGLDYLQRYNHLVYGITAADVQRVARRYLRPDAYALVVAGPVGEPVLRR